MRYSKAKVNHVVILVLGDLGRSPRMQYHAKSLTENPLIHKITMIGYEGSNILQELQSHPKICCERISMFVPSFVTKISLLRVIWKAIYLIGYLFYLFCWKISSYKLIIIQNPPSFPAILIALWMSFCINNSKILIDWHNLNYTMFEHDLGKDHLLTKITYWMEKTFVSQAHYHICVSKQMREWLREHFKVKNISVFYDRPNPIFSLAHKQLTNVSKHHQLLSRLQLTHRDLLSSVSSDLLDKDFCEETIQTIATKNNQYQLITNPRTALVITSTSWTNDEDFDALLQAMQQLEEFISTIEQQLDDYTYHNVLCIITGKGELKDFYLNKIQEMTEQKLIGRRVLIRCRWLEIEDYPLILACCQLGICLHTSTSGLDLPMKVLDMFGVGLPVLAYSYPTINELVHNQNNGLIFRNAHELCLGLIKLLFQKKVIAKSSNSQLTLLQEYQQHVREIQSWDEHYEEVMRPLVDSILQK